MATDTTPGTAAAPGMSPALTLLLATACGLIAANLYYAQPLVDPIRTALHMPAATAGLIVTLSQVGFGAGLLLLVPLADKVENLRLVLTLMTLATLCLVAQAFAPNALVFLTAALGIGVGSVAVQVLVPYASHTAPEAVRGRVVGNVMSGLMFGIMLARPVASFVTELFGWHAIFLVSALAMAGMGLVLSRNLPPRQPANPPSYGGLLASMVRLVREEPVLRRRALYQAAMFGVFTLFWTCAPLLLLGPAYGLSQNGVALFALAGVAGAISAPIAGWAADRGYGGPGTAAAMIGSAAAVLATLTAPHGTALGLGILVTCAIVIDFCTTMTMVISQRALFTIHPELRSRINGIYMATFFMGGAIASAVGGWAYASGGWPRVVAIGVAVPLVALAWFATERRG